MFTIGGAIPILLCIVLAVSIPESIKLLLANRPNDPRIAKVLARLAPGTDPRTVYAAYRSFKRVLVFCCSRILQPVIYLLIKSDYVN
jgi:hypothetical protein